MGARLRDGAAALWPQLVVGEQQRRQRQLRHLERLGNRARARGADGVTAQHQAGQRSIQLERRADRSAGELKRRSVEMQM